MITKILIFLGWFYLISLVICLAFFVWASKNAPTEEELYGKDFKS